MSQRLQYKARHRNGTVCAALAACLIMAVSTAAGARTARPVYFFSDNSKPIDAHNPLVMRPSGFVLFLDGQWVLQHLRWTGWGSPVARAAGISNSATGVPNAARSPRVKTWADMTLSAPVGWRGHMVYSCFKILVPPPASDLSGCVLPRRPIGNGWLVGTGGEVEFLAPGQRIWCGVNSALSFCAGYAIGQSVRSTPSLGASLYPNGKVSLCSVSTSSPGAQSGCAQNWDAAAPVLELGQEVRSGDMLCRSERRGIVCAIASGRENGKGFLVNGTTVSRLG